MCSSDLESQHLLEQDMDLNGAFSNSSSSLSITHFCLMAKVSEVSSTLHPVVSHNDEEHDNFASTHEKGKIVLQALSKNKIASSKFFEIMSTFVKRKELLRLWKLALINVMTLNMSM